MKKFFFIFKTLLYTFIFLGIFNISYSKASEFNYNAKSISNYFSGLIYFDDLDFVESEKVFKKLKNFEEKSTKYSSKFMHSLINLGKYKEAHKYSKKLENKNKSNFESNLFLGLYEFKEKNYVNAKSYFDRLENNYRHQLIFEVLQMSLNSWTEIAISKDKEKIQLINMPYTGYRNIVLIQKVFANCYLGTSNTFNEFERITQSNKSNFSRYHFFFANYLLNNKRKEESKNFINSASKKFPGNLLINQFKKNLENKDRNNFEFDCANSSNIMAEIFYIYANALSSQGDYKLSNFYINLSKFLNPKFMSYDALLAENFFILKKNNEAKLFYEKLSKLGSTYKWYAAKKISVILDEENKDSINFLSKSYNEIEPGIYDTFDFANFLRGKEVYEKAINLYTQLLTKIEKSHELFPKILERRGMAYERSDKWNLAEKDLLMSLKVLPKEPYVMNYLAYSWVEKNKNIETALNMLREANRIKKNDGYITDSLGWVLYKLKNFSEAKLYLEKAIILMPQDPVVNDHFADCLWMNNNKLQARYFWKNVLKLKNADKELKNKVEKKLLLGLQSI
ncbi:MAG: hypothetical protein CBD92_002155 [Pelagibacteraceae bacterium TMED232]|nr:MAG: hypothetical protein CBD92_002155 [Pelagibacteraceae bacterium TMED232]